MLPTVKLYFAAVNFDDGTPVGVEQLGSARGETSKEDGQFAAVRSFQGQVHKLVRNVGRRRGPETATRPRGAAVGKRLTFTHRGKGVQRVSK